MQVVLIDLSPLSLNQEQRKLYDTIVRQYFQELALDISPLCQLLLNVNSIARSRKTFTILKTCAYIQEFTREAREQNLVFRAALIGIAAYNIIRKTLHSLL